jgi:hypothetical protein
MFETMINALIFHGFKLFYIYGLFSSQKLGDWVEARWITWHFQFFMIQYDGLNCFWVSRSFVRKLTKWFEHKMQEINASIGKQCQLALG